MTPTWTKFYDFVPEHLEYPEKTLYETFKAAAYKHRYRAAIDYYGARMRFDTLLDRVGAVSNVLVNLGVRKGDRVGVCLPNLPSAASLFYAVSRLGAVCVMIHPLSSSDEIAQIVRETGMNTLFLTDVALPRHQKTLAECGVHNAVCVSLWEDAPLFKRPFIRRAAVKRAGLSTTPECPNLLREMVKLSDFKNKTLDTPTDPVNDTAVILYSGGSSGRPKGIRLSSFNFNALAYQVCSQVDDWPQDPSMMAILPFFHGFGLGVCLHAALIHGITSVMMAQFSARGFLDILRKKKPNVITGVPTLYEAILREKKAKIGDLSFLRGVFCGGDACPASLKKRFNKFLEEHGASVRLKEGYGLTETVTACVVTPPNHEREGAVGVPLPDVYVKICKAKSEEEMPTGRIGEILVSSPTLMLGYLDEQDTAAVLSRHADGRTWLRTGDLGRMDADGYLYFTGRIKRVVKVSGFPVYPDLIEEVIGAISGVERVCCIAVPDPYKMNVIKAIVVPTDKTVDPKAFARKVMDTAARYLNVYARPRRIELTASLPLTKVGKVNYLAVEMAERKKQQAKAEME